MKTCVFLKSSGGFLTAAGAALWIGAAAAAPLNADVIDLYSCVDVGTKIIVLPNRAAVATIAVAAVPTPARQTYDARSSNIY